MATKRTEIKPMAHQAASLKFIDKSDIVFDMSDPGCVSADTEFLSSGGWKRIDQYKEGDLVGQFYPDTREVELVKPLQYIKLPCKTMIAIAPARGTSQRLSPEHRVLYYRPDGSHGVCSAEEFMKGLHKEGPAKYRRKFCSTFSVRNLSVLDLSDEDIRVMVAVIADGHFQGGSNRCVVRLKKIRKIDRLRSILNEARISFDEITCGGDPDFQVFKFYAPVKQKEFGHDWWGANQDQLEVIANELPYWDSSIDRRGSDSVRFSSFSDASANFAQYAFAASKRPTSIHMSKRDRTNEGRGVMYEYTVHAQHNDRLIGPGRKESVFPIDNPEGFKYCFEVPTSFLLLRHDGYIFATGNTGKTFVQIMAFAKRYKKTGKSALVLAPKSLLKAAWGNDITKFAPQLSYSLAYAENREEAFAADAHIYVTNTDAVNWLVKQSKKFFDRFDTLIIDEVSSFKHATSARSKALNKIKKYFKYRSILSGTPNSNTICDIWNPVGILDDGKRLGGSFFGFRAATCTPKQVGPRPEMVKWVDKDGAEEVVYGQISNITVRHKFADCIDIPETHHYTINYSMPPKQLKTYLAMQKTAVAELNAMAKVTAINAAAVRTKLLQIASGAVYENSEKYHLVDAGRYEMVMDLVQERKHPIVFFLWKHQRDNLVAMAEKRGLTYCVLDGGASSKEREEMEKHYQNGWYDVMFAHPKTAAHGFTFTKGTSTIWPSPPDDAEWFAQANKRQARKGQTEKTEIIVVLAEGTVEMKVFENLTIKTGRMNNLLDLFTL